MKSKTRFCVLPLTKISFFVCRVPSIFIIVVIPLFFFFAGIHKLLVDSVFSSFVHYSVRMFEYHAVHCHLHKIPAFHATYLACQRRTLLSMSLGVGTCKHRQLARRVKEKGDAGIITQQKKKNNIVAVVRRFFEMFMDSLLCWFPKNVGCW